MLYLISCSKKKGGIIIELKNKSVLLNKGLILVPMAILGLTIFTNTSYATNSITGTKDRIKEIKIVEEINIYKLIRNRKSKIVVNNYARNTKITSRSSVDRTNKQEIKQ